jgi:glycosyltransferase involved in cell wall biosynthesis
MLTILRNEELARRLGEAARETVRARFLWKDRIQAYIDIYEGRPGPSLVAGLAPNTPAAAFTASVGDGVSIGYARQPDMRSIGSRERIGTELMPNTEKRVTNVLLTCASDAEIGGVQTLFRDLVYWLEKSGRRVHLVYPAPLPGLRPVEKLNTWGRSAFYFAMPALVKNSPLASVPIFLGYTPITFFNLARLIRKEKIDVINCHFLAPHFIHLVIAARLLRVPVVVSVLGSDIAYYARADWAQRLLYRTIMRSADRIVACSEALAKRASDAFPEVGRKITWVYCALDDSQHMESGKHGDTSQEFVLCVARHVHVKGVDVLLKAFALIHNEVPDVALVLVGDGPLLSEQKALATRLGIGHRVVFRGEVAHSDVPEFFAKCALFVLPSRSEGFSITLLEAAYHGRPIVCTRVGGSPELISNGINGLLVEPDDPAEMAAQMLTILRNEGLALRLGQAARETVRARFLWRDRIQDYIDIYEGRPGPSLAADLEASQPAVRHHEQVASVDPR